MTAEGTNLVGGGGGASVSSSMSLKKTNPSTDLICPPQQFRGAAAPFPPASCGSGKHIVDR